MAGFSDEELKSLLRAFAPPPPSGDDGVEPMPEGVSVSVGAPRILKRVPEPARPVVGGAAPSPSLRPFEPSPKLPAAAETEATATKPKSELAGLVAGFKPQKSPGGESDLLAAQKADRMHDIFANASAGLGAAFTRSAPKAPTQSNANVEALGQQQKAGEAARKQALTAADADPGSEGSLAIQDLIRTLHPEVAAKLGDRLGKLSRAKGLELMPHLEKYAELNRKRADDTADQQAKTTQLQQAAQAAKDRAEDQRLDREARVEAARQHRALMMQLASTRSADAQANKANANELKLGKDRDAQVAALEKRIPSEATGINAKLERINKYMGDPAHANNLPGVGPVTNMIPDFFVSDEGQELRQNATGLVDDLLKMQSGAGVSNVEREKKYAQYGMAKGSPEKMFREGMKNLARDLAAELKKREAGASPEALKTYREQGGFTSSDVGGGPTTQPAGGPTPTGVFKKDKQGVRWERMSDGSARRVSP